MQDTEFLKPADITSEDHEWRDCGCTDCEEIREDVRYSRGL